MNVSPHRTYAVVTGDIVGSSRLPAPKRRELPALLKRASQRTQEAFPEALSLEVAVFRGDGWQLLVNDPTLGLRVGLFFRACLRSTAARGRGLDTRLAVALGGIDFVPGRSVAEGDGEAYRASGRALETLPRKQYLALRGSTQPPPDDIAVVVRLLDALSQGWTGRQALAVMGALQGWTQEAIAAGWPETIARQSVADHLDKARWPATEAGLLYLESNLHRLQ